MQKSNNHKSVAPIPPPLNQRFRRGLPWRRVEELHLEAALKWEAQQNKVKEQQQEFNF